MEMRWLSFIFSVSQYFLTFPEANAFRLPRGEMQGNDPKLSDILEFILEGKNICPSSQVCEAPSIWLSQKSSLFIVLFPVDSNFSIFAINIILIYRRVKLSENYSSNSVLKLVSFQSRCFSLVPDLQNHRRICVGRDHWRLSASTSFFKQGPLQHIIQDWVKDSFSISLWNEIPPPL